MPGGLVSYSASKAALHSHTQSLRIALGRSSNIKVFELMPALVDSEFSVIINGHNGIARSIVAQDYINAVKKNIFEIRIGKTQYIYDLHLKSPAEALNAMQPA